MARDEIERVIAAGLAEHDEEVRARWEQICVGPERWQCLPWGDFWVVAVEGERVLWFNEIEEGFNWSRWSTRGVIDEYGSAQTSFAAILDGFALEISDAARARIGEGEVPLVIAGPGGVEKRQTTYWDVRANRGARYRVHFRDKREVRFVGAEYDGVEITGTHPVLAAYEEPMRALYFTGVPARVRETAEQIDRAIRAASSGWRDLRDYGSSIDAITRQLGDRFGRLVNAPESVCGIIARQLEAAGVQCSILGAATAQSGYRALVLGRSFVIAAGFAFEAVSV